MRADSMVTNLVNFNTQHIFEVQHWGYEMKTHIYSQIVCRLVKRSTKAYLKNVYLALTKRDQRTINNGKMFQRHIST